MKNPLVSIIIPNYNRAGLIEETLDSILKQSYTNWECLVVDDGSTDASESVINAYHKKSPRIKFHKRPIEKPKGANACRNHGLALCKGFYVNWFDSDDIMHADKLLLQVKGLQESNAHFSVCQTMVFKGSIDKPIGLNSNHIKTKHSLEDFFCKKMVWLTQAPLFKKQFLLDNNFLFDETLQAGQEWELFTRILFKTDAYHSIEQPLVYLRQHAGNISNAKTLSKHWYYFLARYKIYKSYKHQLSPVMADYIRFFFIKSFKGFLRTKQYKNALYVWRHCLLPNKMLSLKMNVFVVLSYISFFIFKKGDIFLTRVN